MFDIFDCFAFVVFAVLLATFVVVFIFLGSLPGKIARQRGHPQAAAINVAGWLGMFTFFIFWPLALLWAFMNPIAAVAAEPVAHPPALPPTLPPLETRPFAQEAALSKPHTAPEIR
jgi:hypothetical protein